MKNFWRLMGYVRPYAGRMIVASVLLAFGGAMMAAVVATVKPLINEVLIVGGSDDVPAPAVAEPKEPDILSRVRGLLPMDRVSRWVRDRTFVQVPLLIVVLFTIRAAMLYVGMYLTYKCGSSVIRDIRAELFEKIAFQSLDFFQQHSTGTILSRLNSDVMRLNRITSNILAYNLEIIGRVPFLFLLALVHDWRMTLVMLALLPVLGYPVARLGRRLRSAATASQSYMANLSDRINEAFGNIRVVQSFGMEGYETRRFLSSLEDMLRMDLRAGRAYALTPAIAEVLGAILGAGLFYVAGSQIARQALDPGDFSVVLFSLGLMFVSLRRASGMYAEAQVAMSSADRVFAMMDPVPRIQDRPGARTLERFDHEIRFNHVSFSYGDAPALVDIDLTVQRGETVALVGLSGSGKTTLASLVPRFYDPVEGSVDIDGRDIRTLTVQSVRAQIGLVTQETVIFNDTVRDNIAYGRDDVPMERIEAAARASHSLEFIEQLPQGYETPLGERGSRLSMGQRQRITIARALLKDPPILILDEATSALDAESETIVQAALEELMRGRTSIVIAHRLATVRNADRIVVLDAGRVVEEGTHRELLSRGGSYAKLHDLQFKE